MTKPLTSFDSHSEDSLLTSQFCFSRHGYDFQALTELQEEVFGSQQCADSLQDVVVQNVGARVERMRVDAMTEELQQVLHHQRTAVIVCRRRRKGWKKEIGDFSRSKLTSGHLIFGGSDSEKWCQKVFDDSFVEKHKEFVSFATLQGE